MDLIYNGSNIFQIQISLKYHAMLLSSAASKG